MSEEKAIVLKYTGTGAAIFNVPARDLTQADIDACPYDAEYLSKTGIYKFADQTSRANEATNDIPDADEVAPAVKKRTKKEEVNNA